MAFLTFLMRNMLILCKSWNLVTTWSWILNTAILGVVVGHWHTEGIFILFEKHVVWANSWSVVHGFPGLRVNSLNGLLTWRWNLDPFSNSISHGVCKHLHIFCVNRTGRLYICFGYLLDLLLELILDMRGAGCDQSDSGMKVVHFMKFINTLFENDELDPFDIIFANLKNLFKRSIPSLNDSLISLP